MVLDPGHGGHDSGTRGTGKTKIYEKHVVLAVAKKVAELLKSDPDIKVIMTRNSDKFIELRKRAEIANKNKADVFVSIHCNANPNPGVRGSETYVLGIHRNKDNLEVAKMENAVIKLEEDYQLHYENFDPDDPSTFIGLELAQEEFLDQSILLASLVQKEFQKRVKTKNRSVQQAGFAVLRLTYMPSILTEIGFLSNPQEERFLHSKTGQYKIAQSIANAIKQYKNIILMNSSITTQDDVISEEMTEIENAGKDDQAEKSKSKSKLENQKQIPFDTEGKYYSVQIKLSKNKIPVNNRYFKNLQNIFYVYSKPYYKYYYGKAYSLGQAKKLLHEAKKAGFKDAFLVGFVKGKRVNIRQVGL